MELVSAALVRAQRAFGPALKTSTNPHFKSKYADLSACVEAVLDALNAEGIALVQRNLPTDDGVCVETVFVHESGQMLSSGPLHVPAAKADPQGYGSALTYARRYSLMSACGIAPEDDDGNAAAKAKAQPAAKRAPVIKPTDGADELLDEDARDRMDGVALIMREKYRAGEVEQAKDIWFADDTCADSDERVYLWSCLSKESALRRAIKDDPRSPSNQDRRAA